METLKELEALLHYSPEKLAYYRAYGTSDAVIKGFLSRYLSTVESPQAAVAKLTTRRQFERTLPSLSITPGMLNALRSGAFRVLGRDDQHRVILYVHVRHLSSLFGLEMDETQRLFILLMEYLQFLATVIGSDSPATGATTRGGGNSWSSEQASGGGPSGSVASASRSTAKVSEPSRQEVVVLVNEEGAEWHIQQTLVTKAETFYSLISKFYPGLIGSMLLVGAGTDIREGIQKAYNSIPDRPSPRPQNSSVLQFVPRSALPNYIPSALIPMELVDSSRRGGAEGSASDGRNGDPNRPSSSHYAIIASESAAEFSDLALRQWYTLTAFLLEEDAVQASGGGKGGVPSTSDGEGSLGSPRPSSGVIPLITAPVAYRPLYLLPPHRIVLSFSANAVGLSRLGNTSVLRRSGSSGGGWRRRRLTAGNLPGGGAAAYRDPSHLFSPMSRGDDPSGMENGERDDESHMEEEEYDDGRCSLMTDLDVSFTPDCTERCLRDEMDADFPSAGASLQQAYRVECAMRRAAEQRLEAARVDALPIASQNAHQIEQALISLHQDVHGVVGDVIRRCTMEQQLRGGMGGGAPPLSLEHLLDTTIAALGVAAGVSPTEPAGMSKAELMERMEEEDSGCCCCCC